MCGLVGVYSSGPLNEKELSVFRSMLYGSALRGDHSTGIMLVTKDGTFDYTKSALSPSQFIDYELDKVLDKHKSNILGLFGHTRFATTGKINTKNSHPFVVNKQIIMMHNGNVLHAPKVDVKEYDVDSQALAVSLHKHKDAKDVFSSFFGAAAVLWFDLRDKTFNVYKNEDRSLAFAGGHATTYMASEADMLRWILARSNLGHMQVKGVESNKIFKFPVDTFKNMEEISVPFVSRVQHTTHTHTTQNTGNGGAIKSYAAPAITRLTNVVDINTAKAVQKPYITVAEYGPFERNDTILLCPEKVERIGDGFNFRIKCTPLAFNWTEEYRQQYGETPCMLFIVGKEPELQEEEAKLIGNAPVIEATIKSIKYDRQREKGKRLTVYVGEPTIRETRNF